MQSNLLIISTIIVSYCFALHIEDSSSLDAYPMKCYSNAGDPCLFPAKDENGNDVNQCVGSKCPVVIDSDTLKAKEWAECDPTSCVIACMTVDRKRCLFPFVFEDNDDAYNRRCAKNNEGNFVCATQVDPGTGVALEIGECDMTACPLD